MIPREFVPVRSTTSTAIWTGDAVRGVGGGVTGAGVSDGDGVAVLAVGVGVGIGVTSGDALASPPA